MKYFYLLLTVYFKEFYDKGIYDLAIMKKIISEEQYLTRKQVSEILNCSLATIDRYIRDSVIPSFRIGGLRRFSKKEILKFKEKKTPKA